MPINARRRDKVTAVRNEVVKSALDADRKVVIQDFLGGAERLLDAGTAEEKIDSLIGGTSDIITHLSREAIRSEKVVDDKIAICRKSHLNTISWQGVATILTVVVMLIGMVLKLNGKI